MPGMPYATRARVATGRGSKIRCPKLHKPSETRSGADSDASLSKPGSAEAHRVGVANGQADIGMSRASYAALVVAQIQAHKFYPDSARARGEEGAVGVSFTIQPERPGRISSYYSFVGLCRTRQRRARNPSVDRAAAAARRLLLCEHDDPVPFRVKRRSAIAPSRPRMSAPCRLESTFSLTRHDARASTTLRAFPAPARGWRTRWSLA